MNEIRSGCICTRFSMACEAAVAAVADPGDASLAGTNPKHGAAPSRLCHRVPVPATHTAPADPRPHHALNLPPDITLAQPSCSYPKHPPPGLPPPHAHTRKHAHAHTLAAAHTRTRLRWHTRAHGHTRMAAHLQSRVRSEQVLKDVRRVAEREAACAAATTLHPAHAGRSGCLGDGARTRARQ